MRGLEKRCGVRAAGVRVRTGCITCKIRRVKCDEEKPACQRCIQSGRECDGYSFVSPRSKHPLRALPPQYSDAKLKAITKVPLHTTSFYSIPFKVPGSQRDRQLLHYFYVHAVADLAGFSICSSDFWQCMVLQCSQNDPVIRSALLAVASMHRKFATEEEPAVGIATPLELYNKAIRRLHRYLNQPTKASRKTILVCCALFYCFDSARGEQTWALNHLQTALNILQEIAAFEGGSVDGLTTEDIDATTNLFSRMDVQASVFAVDRTPCLRLTSEDERTGATSCVPSHFTNLSEAETILVKLHTWSIRFVTIHSIHKGLKEDEFPAELIPEFGELKEQLRQWGTVFAALLKRQEKDSHSQNTSSRQNTISMLKVHHICYSMAIIGFPEVSETDQERMKTNFGNALDEVEAILHRQSLEANQNLRGFSSDTCFIDCLSYIACKCSHRPTRERALSILDQLNRQEGLWDAKTMAGTARKLMELKLEEDKIWNEKDTSVNDWAADVLDHYESGFDGLAKTLYKQRWDIDPESYPREYRVLMKEERGKDLRSVGRHGEPQLTPAPARIAWLCNGVGGPDRFLVHLRAQGANGREM